jgi:hypothetical protein
MAKRVLSSGHNGEFGRDEIRYTDGTFKLVGDLIDSDTNETLRNATVHEQLASDASEERGQHGHIKVDGRRCYVA